MSMKMAESSFYVVGHEERNNPTILCGVAWFIAFASLRIGSLHLPVVLETETHTQKEKPVGYGGHKYIRPRWVTQGISRGAHESWLWVMWYLVRGEGFWVSEPIVLCNEYEDGESSFYIAVHEE